MLRRFRHRLFLLLEAGILLTGGLALLLWPLYWKPIAVCVGGALCSALVCERLARGYLKKTLGSLRRAADDIGHGRRMETIEAQPGDDMYKLVSAINLLAERLARASEEELRLQDELRRRERLAFLGELAASVAHEVNNPLDGVQNCSRILRRSLGEPQRASHMLDLIDSGLSRIEMIVRRLLTLARENTIRPVEAHVRQVAEAAIRSVRERIENRRLRIETHWTSDDDRADIDPLLIEHVFANLLLNAADSMPGGGRIAIRVAREVGGHAGGGDAIRVEIEDDGVGIPPELLPHLFDPFVTTKTDGKGTGLGLAIAARIVDAHHGSITVHPKSGQGTVFAVQLPARSTDREIRRQANDASGIRPSGAEKPSTLPA
jgi:signal transduction histidine kinase